MVCCHALHAPHPLVGHRACRSGAPAEESDRASAGAEAPLQLRTGSTNGPPVTHRRSHAAVHRQGLKWRPADRRPQRLGPNSEGLCATTSDRSDGTHLCSRRTPGLNTRWSGRVHQRSDRVRGCQRDGSLSRRAGVGSRRAGRAFPVAGCRCRALTAVRPSIETVFGGGPGTGTLVARRTGRWCGRVVPVQARRLGSQHPAAVLDGRAGVTWQERERRPAGSAISSIR
jgi:hypothetical protein